MYKDPCEKCALSELSKNVRAYYLVQNSHSSTVLVLVLFPTDVSTAHYFKPTRYPGT